MRVRVTNVRGLKGEDRKGVVYVGRAFAGWPGTPYGNTRKLPCPGEFRKSLLALPAARLHKLLDDLYESCGQGEKPLGCWCLEWDGKGKTPMCHAAVWAELLNARFPPEETDGLFEMRALTVKQPWAWAIVFDDKRVENRTWDTTYRGKLLIHAGMDHADVSRLKKKPKEWPGTRFPDATELVYGAFVGIADLVACVSGLTPRTPPAIREECESVWANEGAIWWVLDNVIAFPKPVAASGKLGLWVPSRDVESEIVAQTMLGTPSPSSADTPPSSSPSAAGTS